MEEQCEGKTFDNGGSARVKHGRIKVLDEVVHQLELQAVKDKECSACDAI